MPYMVGWMGAPGFLVFTSITLCVIAASVMLVTAASDNNLFFIVLFILFHLFS